MDTVRLTLCSHGTVMGDAVLISKGGWKPSREGLTEGLAPGESWPTLVLLSQSTHCVCLGATQVNNALTPLRKDLLMLLLLFLCVERMPFHCSHCRKTAFPLLLRFNFVKQGQCT